MQKWSYSGCHWKYVGLLHSFEILQYGLVRTGSALEIITSGNSVLTFRWCGLRVLIPDFFYALFRFGHWVAVWLLVKKITMSNVAKSSEPKGYFWDGHSGFVYAAYHTWIQQLLALLFQIVFHCGDKGQGEDKEQAKLKVAMMFRGLIWDSACGTGCLFNLERMWIMWAKIPEHQTGGPLVCWCQAWQSVQGSGIPVPLIWAIFVPRSKMWAFCTLCDWCLRIFWSIWMSSTLLMYGALHLLKAFFLIKTKRVVL